MNASANLSLDDDVVVWSVPREEVSERLSNEPLVVVMHGRGSDENDLAALFPLLPEGVVYASLRAPLPGAPYGIGGWSWFPPGEPADPSMATIDAAGHAVLSWLDRVEASFGAPPAVAVLGFSQGGAMAVHLMRLAPYRFAAAVNLSGFSASGSLPGDAELATRRPPLFWGRDEADPVIAASGILRTAAWVPEYFTVTAALYPGVGHGISPQELADVSAFLRGVLPVDPVDQVPAD
ncbi:alpha/beta hydrolase-fold protein [Herbiconiux sp. CPCC 205763]|uniref:Alpha/beta hydrolase-fold protein n=1 Tax=Herbiconiux aconitum TaxID=2970913 RepID=A0ABT2GPR4_9MICO|nr:alpha/beta hydrolase-fold protein [Herbiconiux aconitum]MCS5718163.1 alpha/beta hydrolase-fold protein [Herbiconiux aconitum]